MTDRLSSCNEAHSQSANASIWKRLSKRLALLGTTLLLVAAGAEIAVRLFTDTIPPLTVKDPDIGQRYIASFEDTIYVPEADRRIKVRFNRFGFRGPDWTETKPPGVRRIAILGDSMVASLVVDEEDTMVCQLERLLNQSNPEATWEVLNFGVAGASPGQGLTLYKNLVSRFDPDIVLCAYFVGNDLADNCSRLSNNPRIYYELNDAGELQQQPFPAERAKVSAFLNRYSRFYVWQKDAVNKLFAQAKAKSGMLPAGEWIFCRNESEDLAYAWRLSAEINRAFQKEVTNNGAMFGVLLLPSGWQVYRDVFQTILDLVPDKAQDFDWDYPNQRLKALCEEANIPLVTMLTEFREAAPSGSASVKSEWLFHLGYGHYNERGNALAAKIVHRFLTEGDRQNALAARQPFVTRLR